MNIRSSGDRQQHVVGVLTAVEHVHTVKFKIHNVYLRVVLPQIVPELIDIVAPAAVHQQQVFPVKVRNLQHVLFCQSVVDGNGAAKSPSDQLQSRAAPQLQRGLVEDAAHHANVLAEAAENFPCVFQRVLKGDDLEFDVRAALVDLCPQRHQKLHGRHGRRADADDVFVLLYGVLRPRHRAAVVLDDVSLAS